jgi:small neutral amino acid transporter SnatA (MarC family)
MGFMLNQICFSFFRSILSLKLSRIYIYGGLLLFRTGLCLINGSEIKNKWNYKKGTKRYIKFIATNNINIIGRL